MLLTPHLGPLAWGSITVTPRNPLTSPSTQHSPPDQSNWLCPSSTASSSPSSLSAGQVMSWGSQDWLASWGWHWVMIGGPAGGWLSRQRPLTMCCKAEPLGLHFCTGEKAKKWKIEVITNNQQQTICHNLTLLQKRHIFTANFFLLVI